MRLIERIIEDETIFPYWCKFETCIGKAARSKVHLSQVANLRQVWGMRDIITHHYFDIDAETVFTVCSKHVPRLKNVLKIIRNDIK